MTVDQLATCLSVTTHAVRYVVKDMKKLGVISDVGRVKGCNNSPRKLWGLAA